MDFLGQLASDRAAQHHDVMAQPQQRAQKWSGVGTGGEASIALMLGLGSGRVSHEDVLQAIGEAKSDFEE